jgi:hypothetical protein
MLEEEELEEEGEEEEAEEQGLLSHRKFAARMDQTTARMWP